MDDWDDEPVGYGSPPKWTRFRKGRSGNPEGRPRKQKPKRELQPESETERILKAILAETVRVKDGGVSREMTKGEALRRAQIATAIKGNSAALRDLFHDTKAMEKAGHARQLALEHAATKKAEKKRGEKEALFEYFAGLKEKRARMERGAGIGQDRAGFSVAASR